VDAGVGDGDMDEVKPYRIHVSSNLCLYLHLITSTLSSHPFTYDRPD